MKSPSPTPTTQSNRRIGYLTRPDESGSQYDSLAGQEMLILLAQLAHNLIIWARGWLSEKAPKLKGYGIKRWVRDLLTMKGKITFKDKKVVKVRLSGLHQLARQFFEPLAAFFNQIGVRLILSKR